MSLWEEFSNINVQEHERLHPELFAYVKGEMEKPEKQFLLIGDTNHYNGSLRKFLKSPALVALFNHAVIPHVCIEYPRELAPPAILSTTREKVAEHGEIPEAKFWNELLARAWDWHKISPKGAASHPLHHLHNRLKEFGDRMGQGSLRQKIALKLAGAVSNLDTYGYKNSWEHGLLGFTYANLRVTAADSLQWQEPIFPGLGERLFLGDREVAAYIKGQAGQAKTVVIYGSAHFRYHGTMGANLKRDNSLQVDVYSSRDSYTNPEKNYPHYADFIPERVYLLKERALEKPNPYFYRRAANLNDDLSQRRKSRIDKCFGAAADPGERAALVAKITKLPHIDSEYFNYVPPQSP